MVFSIYIDFLSNPIKLNQILIFYFNQNLEVHLSKKEKKKKNQFKTLQFFFSFTIPLFSEFATILLMVNSTKFKKGSKRDLFLPIIANPFQTYNNSWKKST